jgi:dipicolinate synthase subunit A
MIGYIVEQGDKRMDELLRILKERGYDAQAFTQTPGEAACLIVSPGKKIGELINILEKLPPGSVLIGGQSASYIEPAAKARGVRYACVTDDETFAVQNAIPTAEGALSLIIANTDHTVLGMDIVIVGFGRIGKALAPMLRELGARVHVVARSPVQRAWAANYNCYAIENMKEALGRCTVLVNTVPARIIGYDALSSMKKGSLALELASYPYGYDADEAEALGIRSILAQGLPSKVAPSSAAEYLADAAVRLCAQS